MEQVFVTMLGTAATKPTRHRNTSATLVQIGGVRTLIDCGEGAQQALLRHANLGTNAIDRLVLTHFHSDHYIGLVGILKTRGNSDDPGVLDIYCNEADAPKIEGYLKATFTSPRLYRIVPVSYGKEIELESGWSMVPFAAKHSVVAMSVAFVERAQPPRFDAESAREDGCAHGPDMGILARGGSVALSDGRVLNGADYLGDERPGRRFVHSADTEPTDTLLFQASSANLLICEATYKHEDVQRARENGHTTAREAGELSRRADVGQLVLTHFSTFYPVREILNEAKSFAGHVPVDAPRDGDCYEVTASGAKKARTEMVNT